MATAREGVKAAEAAKSDEYIRLNKEVIVEAEKQQLGYRTPSPNIYFSEIIHENYNIEITKFYSILINQNIIPGKGSLLSKA